MTHTGLSRITSMIAEEHPVEFSSDRLRLWSAALRDVTDEQGYEAVVRLLQTSPYPPKVADVRRMLFGSADDAERRLDEEAELAVAHIERHLCDYRLCDFGPVLNAVVRAMGGLDAVSIRMAEDGWKYDRARAKTLYRAYRRRGVGDAEGAMLTPAILAASLAHIALADYQERGLPLPIVREPFMPESVAALPAGRTE